MAVAVLHNTKTGDNYVSLSQADQVIHFSLAISNQPYSPVSVTVTSVMSVDLTLILREIF